MKLALLFAISLSFTFTTLALNRNYILVNDIEKSWSEADAFCLSEYGTSLATVITENEKSKIRAMIEPLGNLIYWTGLTRQNSVNWYWIDGTECVEGGDSYFCTWTYKQIGGAAGGWWVNMFESDSNRCGVLHQWASFNDWSCNSNRPFICNAPITEVYVRVNHYDTECIDESSRKCLLVQRNEKIGTNEWLIFNGNVAGFTYVPGYIYYLHIKCSGIDFTSADCELLSSISQIEYESNTIYKCSTHDAAAIEEIHSVILELIIARNLTLSTSQLAVVRDVYDHFDRNSDGLLSFTEFIDYDICWTDYYALFDNINFYNDSIISFREMTSYLMSFEGIAKDLFISSMKGSIKEVYDYDYDTATAEDNKQTFYEYGSDLYFALFDNTSESHLTLNKFVDGMQIIEFYRFKQDSEFFSDHMAITWDEFINHQFNVSEDILKLYDTNNGNFIYNYSQLISKFDEDYLLELEFTVCPSSSTRMTNSSSYEASIISREPSEKVRRLIAIAPAPTSTFRSLPCVPPTAPWCKPSTNKPLSLVSQDVSCGMAGSQAIGGCNPLGPLELTLGAECVVGTYKTATRCPTAIEKTSKACFGAENNWLLVKNMDTGKINNIMLSELKIGDYVQSKSYVDNSENIIWSKVWFINEHYGKYEMIQLQYMYNHIDGERIGNLTLTKDHLLYHNNFELVRADNVLIGDQIKLAKSAKSVSFIDAYIIDISYNVYDYARSPITMDGDIIVSSVLSSCYTKSKSNAKRLHSASRLFRDISDVNTQFAAHLTNFFYNYVYKFLKSVSMGSVCEFYATAPIVSVLFFTFIFQTFSYFH